jgi:hypothetical protein
MVETVTVVLLVAVLMLRPEMMKVMALHLPDGDGDAICNENGRIQN